MRLSVDAGCRLFALGLTAATLAGCGLVGNGGDRPQALAVATDPTGPAADYPMVLGDPYSVDGVLYTPADTMNYDVVGYAAIDAGQGVTVAHRTLPLPSYVEITSLTSGKTILARVERRGPMSGAEIIALAPAAAGQLGEDAGGAIRLRRVNPPEKDRIELRAGRAAPDRIETPKSLVEVLRRKLPATGAASLRPPVPARPALAAERPQAEAVAKAPAELAPVSRPAPAPADVSSSPTAVAAYLLQPLERGGQAAKPVVARTDRAPVAFTVSSVPEAAAPTAKPAAPKGAAERRTEGEDGFVVQAGAFSNRTSAQRVAEALGGYVSPTGKLFRVRTGPFTSRGQAEAALAKVRAAGYSDARVYTAG